MIKESLKEAMLQIRQQLSTQTMEQATTNIIEQISNDKNFKKAKVVGLYHPIFNEVNILDIMVKFPNKIYALPKLYYNHIRYYKYDESMQLVKNSYGILEPKNKEDITHQIEYVLVPCVAISPDKVRLGYGHGYYDKFFIKQHKMIKVGVAYYFQEIDVAQKSYDVLMDYYFLG